MTDPSDNRASKPPAARNKARMHSRAATEGKRTKRKVKGKSRQRSNADKAVLALDEQGRERPAFLLDLPDDPELNRLVAAFERGDYRLVRAEADQLAAATSNPAVRRAARELRRRIDPDPLAKYLLFVAIALLTFVVFWTYFLHGH